MTAERPCAVSLLREVLQTIHGSDSAELLQYSNCVGCSVMYGVHTTAQCTREALLVFEAPLMLLSYKVDVRN